MDDQPILPPPNLAGLVDRITAQYGFADLIAALPTHRSAMIDGAWNSAAALAVAALLRHVPTTVLVVLPREKELDAFALDVASFSGVTPLIFPAWELLPQELRMSDPVLGSRLRVVKAIESLPAPRVVITIAQALLQPVPARSLRDAATRTWRVGEELDLEDLSRWLIDRGFERVPALEMPGEFAIHGGIVDLFSPDAADPVRIELFGDEVESIRTFDVETQMKVADLREVTLTLLTGGRVDEGEELSAEGQAAEGAASSVPAAYARRSALGADSEHIVTLLPENSWIVLQELEDLQSEARLYLQRLDDRRGLFGVEATWELCTRRPTIYLAGIGATGYQTACHLRVTSIDRFTRAKQEALKELSETLHPEESVLIACHNEGSRERLQELLAEHAGALQQRMQICVGHVSKGFRLVSDNLVVLSDNELFGRTEVVRTPRKKSRIESRAIDSFLDLAEGDLIVHLSHGIGRYRGMKLLDKEGQQEEHMDLEFKEGVHLFVPVSLIHLVQKYVGGGKSAPELSKVGGTGWAKKKQKVAEAVSDMAADMLKLQAERDAKPGLACPPDSHWMQEFEAAFPYTETDDQLRAIQEAKEDQERPRPMDRLICGDVGYGKTEVAMRAAFKAVDAGRQVAILVPTTVLAEQHFRSFSERMAEFPVSLASLSRFKTAREQKETLQALADGTVDIVIGTHRLVSPDVRFKDLGLLVIDEEQRFGVETKEMLKHLRLEVDVLTLSATPIPRTLHLSLLGVRDISNLETPPRDRVAIETRVSRFDAELVRHAIVRELNRGGQVYFVHNRVYNIESIADKLNAIVPEAKVGIVHGQMNQHELEVQMLGFVRGETDILVATTIIESGLDIPNANTIFIHQADQYGLSDLHQLRGRVGRYKHRAYCYLLLDEGKTLTSTAARRLKAIEEYSELGAGFKIAMRDLEIRGAGNILGTEQSGHIAAVGYELYCHLLENAVRAMKREPLKQHRHVAVDLPLSAYLPEDYVPQGRQKIEMYRKISLVQNAEQLELLRAEFRDRFGPLPLPVETLLEIRELQHLALAWQIDEIRLEDGYAVFGYRIPRKIHKLAKQSPVTLRVVDDRHAYLVLPPRLKRETELMPLLKSVLQVSTEERYNPPLVSGGVKTG
ncbi:MAG: transcription-repair coupling factor [Planctomycetaceae bacterium]|nr:transcription-repair coupling factor [Planctomycetaceae bacterium]